MQLKVLFILLIPSLSFALENQAAPKSMDIFNQMSQLKSELESISELKPDQYPIKVKDFRNKANEYIEESQKKCLGKYSSITLTSTGLSKQEKRKLTRVERTLCYRELKKFQMKFINKMYQAQKNYMEYIHAKRLVDLKSIMEHNLRRLDLIFKKIR